MSTISHVHTVCQPQVLDVLYRTHEMWMTCLSYAQKLRRWVWEITGRLGRGW